MEREQHRPRTVGQTQQAMADATARATQRSANAAGELSLARAYGEEAIALRRLIEENADGIVVVGDDGVVCYANRAAARLFGRARGDLVGKLFGFPIGRGDSLEIEIVRPNGDPAVAEMRVVGSSWHGMPASIVSLRDVTIQRQLAAQLRQAQKMDALGRLAGGISHDFNNMLTSILCEASVLVEALEPNDPRRRAARQIQKTATRAAELTSQLLTFSRGRVVKPKIVDVVPVVRDMERMLRRIIGDRVELRTRYDVASAHVLLERGPLEQILLNLSVNARDALPDGGVLEIALSHQTIETGAGAGAGDGQYAQLLVRDDGTGMDSAVLARIFEPFFTTKPDGRGSGLGLSVVYGIVDQAGGRISVHSEPGSGTVFQVLIPRAQIGDAGPVAGAAEPNRTTKSERSAPAVILLAEDEPAVREIVSEILATEGHEVLTARDGFDAEAVLAKASRPIDLVVTDVSMPRRTGPELVALLRQQGVQAPVVFLSGYPKDEGLDGHFDWSNAEFVAKPFSHQKLVQAVRSMLKHRTAASARPQ